MRRTTWLAALAAGAAPSALVAQATTGTITGRVTDRASGQPIAAAQVQVVGLAGRGAATNDNGVFRIAAVPAGSYQLRVLRIGFGAQTAPVQVTAGGTATADVVLGASAINLDQVVVTATGEQVRRREQGNVVASITPSTEQLAATANVTDVLNSRTPSVYVQQSAGTSGTGSRIRIRGANSLSLNNEPLLVVDGIRANNDVGNRSVSGNGVGTNVGTGGQVISRLNDINPDDIESIEVIKGPAGVSLYGTAAANGVIQITTKKGRAGATQVSAYGEGGALRQTVDLPANYANVGATVGGANNGRPAQCTNDAFTRGVCTQGTLRSLRPATVDNPFQNGGRQAGGLSARGGGDRATYYVSADWQNEKGVQATNFDNRYNLRANLTGNLTPNWTVAVNSGYLSDRLRLPVNDNSTLGLISVTLLGRAFAADTQSGGFFNNYTPTILENLSVRQNVDRFTTSGTTNYQVTKWLTLSGVGGVDYVGQGTNQVILPQRVAFGDLIQGSANSNPLNVYTWTAQGNATLNFTLPKSITSQTQLGSQYSRELFRGTNAFGAVLTPGTSSLSGATSRFAVSAFNQDNRLVGFFGSQKFGWRDRLFATVSLRSDRNSATGKNFKFVNQPSANVSYVLSDESFFPKNDILSSVQLRAAWGQSTQRPRFTDAITYLQPYTVRVNDVETAAISFGAGSLGDPNLRPEKSTEVEGGVDLGFLNGRVTSQLNYYNKRTNDLLILAPVAPSVGAVSAQYRNLGLMRNRGFEFQVNATLLDTRPARIEFGVGGNTNDNLLIRTGLPAPIQVSTQQQHRDGYPAGGFWQTPYSYRDANGDGIISRAEVTVDTALRYLGNPLPKREFQFSPAVTLFQQFRVGALVSARGQYKVLNSTNRFRCVFAQNCQDVNDPTAPLDLQARAIAAAAYNTDAGYIESGAFTRLRELTFTLTAPPSLLARAGVRRVSNLSLTVAGRNLATWTNYTGLDPEITSTPGSNFASSDFLTVPPVRQWVTRVNFAF